MSTPSSSLRTTRSPLTSLSAFSTNVVGTSASPGRWKSSGSLEAASHPFAGSALPPPKRQLRGFQLLQKFCCIDISQPSLTPKLALVLALMLLALVLLAPTPLTLTFTLETTKPKTALLPMKSSVSSPMTSLSTSSPCTPP